MVWDKMPSIPFSTISTVTEATLVATTSAITNIPCERICAVSLHGLPGGQNALLTTLTNSSSTTPLTAPITRPLAKRPAKVLKKPLLAVDAAGGGVGVGGGVEAPAPWAPPAAACWALVDVLLVPLKKSPIGLMILVWIQFHAWSKAFWMGVMILVLIQDPMLLEAF